MLIEVEGKGTNRVITQLDRMPTVQAIHTTNGKWDLIIELGTQPLADLDAVLKNIRLIDGITNSETNLYLSTKRSNRPVMEITATD
jgi:DNA-binding Lrp family transcriptional regulator